MRIEEDPLASGGKYVLSPEGGGRGSELVRGLVHIPIDIVKAGEYAVWARVKGLDVHSNSFFVQLDELADITWQFPVSGDWRWRRIKEKNSEESYAPFFQEGSHVLTFKIRGDGAAIDRILLTSYLGDDLKSFPEPEPIPLLLDIYLDVHVALSLRLLRKRYTGPAITVQRDIDGAEIDVVF